MYAETQMDFTDEYLFQLLATIELFRKGNKNGVTFSNSGLSTDDNCSCCKSVDFIMPVKESLKEIFQRRAGIKNNIK